MLRKTKVISIGPGQEVEVAIAPGKSEDTAVLQLTHKESMDGDFEIREISFEDLVDLNTAIHMFLMGE